MRKFYKNLQSKGSITVEACVILPVFLSVFFLLLFLVKLTCTGMVLDYAVNETAKEIATSAYPISLINELEDDKIGEYENTSIPTLQEELEKLAGQTGGLDTGNVLNIITSEDFDGTEISEVLKVVLEDYREGIIGGIVDSITPVYWDMKSAGKYAIADALIKEHLNSPLLDSEKVKLRLAEFPQGKAEFNTRSKSELYESYGLTPKTDFNDDDVVIQVEYDYKVKLPFVKALNIKMIHTAVERAWIKGSYGILAADEEGLDLEPDGSTVYITRTGIRYHEGSCWHLRRSKIPITVEGAIAEGYTPCKVCRPMDNN